MYLHYSYHPCSISLVFEDRQKTKFRRNKEIVDICNRKRGEVFNIVCKNITSFYTEAPLIIYKSYLKKGVGGPFREAQATTSATVGSPK